MTTILDNGFPNQARVSRLILPPADRFVDKLQVWLPFHPSNEWMLALADTNKGVEGRGAIHIHRKPMKFQPFFQCRLQINQPKLETLVTLESLIWSRPYLINYVELSSDHAYSGKWSRLDRDRHFDLLSEGWIRKYHRAAQGVRVVKGEKGDLTRYDGKRHSRNLTAMYREEFARNTGEEHNLHLEWRVSSKEACERIGIKTIQDIINFDHDRFWSEKLERVYQLDMAHLGRILRNKYKHTRHRKFMLHQYRHNGVVLNVSAREGHIYVMKLFGFRRHGLVQKLVDKYGFRFLKPALVRIEVVVETFDV